MKRLLVAVALAVAVTPAYAQSRIASDFEIATAKKEIASSRNQKSLIAAHLNLGDLLLSRRDGTDAREHYRAALEIAQKERVATRRRSELNGYAVATSYAGLANAKLGNEVEAFNSFEEAMRYSSDSPSAWNLYSSAMRVIGESAKAVAAARNAVLIESASQAPVPSVAEALDLAVYRYALAAALLEDDGCRTCRAEASALLQQVVAALEGSRFDPLRREIAREEQFEIFSSTRGDPASYLSLLNRSRMQLARVFEHDGRTADARSQYERVLDLRSDDPAALAALARLAGSDEERRKFFAASFEANPFSASAIAEYEAYARANPSGRTTGDSPGALVRRAVEEYVRGRFHESDAALGALGDLRQQNDVVRYLRARNAAATGDRTTAESLAATLTSSPDLQRSVRQLLAESSRVQRPPLLDSNELLIRDPTASDVAALLSLLRTGTLTPEDRIRLDSLSISSVITGHEVVSDGETTTIGGGTIAGTRFTFAAPTVFRGNFANAPALRLEFRILGVTESDRGEALLVEPVRLEAAR